MARWVCSRSTRSRRARSKWRGPSRRSKERPSSAAATRLPRSPRRASPIASRTSRPAAAHRWNSSAAASCRVSSRSASRLSLVVQGSTEMRIPFIAANWKMFKTVHEAFAFTREFAIAVKDIADVEIVLAPPFTAVHTVAEAARNSRIGVAGQDVYWEREGAFTGEVSAGMLKEAGAEYVIIGHSERRRLFHETDKTVNLKVMAALGAHLT